MGKSITILNRVPKIAPAGAVGVLFECASDSAIRGQYPGVISLSDLIGEFEVVKQEAFILAQCFLREEPALCGLKQLGIFEELVIRELQHILHARKLHDRLLVDGFDTCLFTGASRLAQDLEWFSSRLGSAITVQVLATPVNSSSAGLKRSWQRLLMGGFSQSAFANEWRQVMERIDPFHRRSGFTRRKPQPRHAVWFYSTAYTFTRIGLIYEPYFPTPFEYLIENPMAGGLPLKSAGRSFSSPYEFTSLDMAPSGREVAEAREQILTHLKSIKLAPEDAAARDAYLVSAGFSTFMQRLLPRGLFQTRLFERFIEATEPAAVVVGNPVFEGYALHAARKAGIPTLLLQHGVLGDFCQFSDPPVDQYIVRGGFWRDFLAPEPRKRALVLNPVDSMKASETAQSLRRKVLFLTAPYSMQEYWNETDLDDILLALLKACEDELAELVIRVHPLEQIGTYESVMHRLSREKSGICVSYSQGGDLDELLQHAAVAVMFSSTAFMDCLRHRVPIVSFNWHDFSYKRQVAESGVFHFCESLADLRKIVRDAVRGELPSCSSSITPFLESTAEVEIREKIGLALGPSPI